MPEETKSGIVSSQFAPQPPQPPNPQVNQNAPKADEHGIDPRTIKQNPTQGETKLEAPNKPTTQPTTTAPRPTLGNLPPTTKTSATNPGSLTGGKIGVVDFTSETDNNMGVTVEMKRSDGVTLQFPLSFIERQDLYNTKNMFDLVGKIVGLSEEQLTKEYPAFVKGPLKTFE